MENTYQLIALLDAGIAHIIYVCLTTSKKEQLKCGTFSSLHFDFDVPPNEMLHSTRNPFLGFSF